MQIADRTRDTGFWVLMRRNSERRWIRDDSSLTSSRGSERIKKIDLKMDFRDFIETRGRHGDQISCSSSFWPTKQSYKLQQRNQLCSSIKLFLVWRSSLLSTNCNRMFVYIIFAYCGKLTVVKPWLVTSFRETSETTLTDENSLCV